MIDDEDRLADALRAAAQVLSPERADLYLVLIKYSPPRKPYVPDSLVSLSHEVYTTYTEATDRAHWLRDRDASVVDTHVIAIVNPEEGGKRGNV